MRSGATPLVYVFVIDGADGDEYENGRLPFIKGLVDKRGTYYAESRAIMVAETNPNHTAMITGAYADTSGIPANDFAMYGNGASSAEGVPAREAHAGPFDDWSGTGLRQGPDHLPEHSGRRGADKVTSAGIFGKPKLATLFRGQALEEEVLSGLPLDPLHRHTRPVLQEGPAQLLRLCRRRRHDGRRARVGAQGRPH